MTNWYKNNKEKLSSQERWICSIMESLVKASDKQDMDAITSLLPILKQYLSEYDESKFISEEIKSFVRQAKNRLLSGVLSPHNQFNKLLPVIYEYEVLRS